MTTELDQMYNQMNMNQIPTVWRQVCYASEKNFASWIDDLKSKIDFMKSWQVRDILK